jgi:hypothetical protein
VGKEEQLAGLVLDKWGAENGVKYLSSMLSTVVSDAQMQVLITDLDNQ